MESATTDSASIGEVARAAGVAPSAIRYYERIGLLPRPRRVSGRRRYGPDAVARLRMIGLAKDLGFTLAEIKVLLHGMAKGERPARRLQALARTKLPDVEATLRRARLMQRLLRAAERCQCPTLEDCLRAVEAAGAAPR